MANIFYTIIIYPITQILELVFIFSQNIFKETGITIICISGAVSILCLPLYMVAEKWQEVERNIQKRLAPKITKIKAVFKGDERYMILSAYYRQNHYHPIYALRSSFGLLIQIPFFIAAYSYFSQLQALNGVSFLFIRDLGKPDALLPIMGGINLLPIVMTLINCAAGMIYTRGLEIKDKIQLYGMALVFMVLLYNSPAALVLYWTLNNVFSLLKNGYLKIAFKKKHFFLFGIISIFTFILAYYALFKHHGNPKIRILVAVLSIIIGVFSWIIPIMLRFIKKINHTSWTSRETLFLFVSSLLILWIATGVFLPSMLIASSPQEFSFIDDVRSPLYFIFNTAVQSLGLFVFWPLMIYFLFSEKIKNIFSILAVIISLSALCNIFIFHGNYGLISSDLVFAGEVSHNLKEITINIFVLLILFIFLSLVYIRGGRKILSFLVIVLFFAFIPISVKNLFFINTEFKKLSEYYVPESKTEETISPIFHFSKTGKNVLVIMLDAAKSVFIPYIFEESPELYEKYEGFVYFPNTATFNGHTKGGAPPIFGGYEYTPDGLNSRADASLHDKKNEALLMMPTLFSSSDFSVIFTDPPYTNDDNWIPDIHIFDNLENVSGHITVGVYTNLWLKRNNSVLPPHSEVLKRNILWYAVFREVPFALRQALYYNGSWCASFNEYRMRPFLNNYAVLDYLDELTDFEPKKEKSAVIMVNNITHDHYFLQAPSYEPQLVITNYGNTPFSKDVWYHANAAAIKRLSEYFDFLKSHGVYDNTRIILVSDHGQWNAPVPKGGLPFNIDQYNALLLVKDFNARGPMKTDMTFMTNADVPALAMKEIIQNPVNPFTGKAITTDQKNNPLLIIIGRLKDKNKNEIDINQQNTYSVHDNILDEKNWIKPEN